MRAYALTVRQARALAGEWYEWFVARHPLSDLRTWEDLRDKVHEALQEAVGDDKWQRNNPDNLWCEDEDLRATVRPVLADVGETAQFLATKGQALNTEARGRFLDWLYDDLSAALRLLMRREEGDYSTDKYPNRFPKADLAADSGITPTEDYSDRQAGGRAQASIWNCGELDLRLRGAPGELSRA